MQLAKTVGPSTKDFRSQKHDTSQWRKKTREGDLRMPERMMEKDTRRNVCNIYKYGGKVFVRVSQQLSILY